MDPTHSGLRNKESLPALNTRTKSLPLPTAWNSTGKVQFICYLSIKMLPLRKVIGNCSYLFTPWIGQLQVFPSWTRFLVNRRWLLCLFCWLWQRASLKLMSEQRGMGVKRGKNAARSLNGQKGDGKIFRISNSFQFHPGSTLPMQPTRWNQGFVTTDPLWTVHSSELFYSSPI